MFEFGLIKRRGTSGTLETINGKDLIENKSERNGQAIFEQLCEKKLVYFIASATLESVLRLTKKELIKNKSK